MKKRIKSVKLGWKCLCATMLLTSLGMLAVPILFTGCGTLGNNATDPGKFEHLAYQESNTVLTLTVARTNYVNVTNVIPVIVPVITTNTVTLTNVQNQVVVEKHTETNYITLDKPVVTREEHVLPAGSQVTVPQLGAATGLQSAVITGGSMLGNLWGVGGVVGVVLSGLGHWWQNSRNRALVAKYTGATSTSNALSQAAGALTQQVQTLIELVKTTPQGAPYAAAAEQWLEKHAMTTNTVETITQLVTDNVDSPAAREAAQAIRTLVQGLGASPATPAKA